MSSTPCRTQAGPGAGRGTRTRRGLPVCAARTHARTHARTRVDRDGVGLVEKPLDEGLEGGIQVRVPLLHQLGEESRDNVGRDGDDAPRANFVHGVVALGKRVRGRVRPDMREGRRAYTTAHAEHTRMRMAPRPARTSSSLPDQHRMPSLTYPSIRRFPAHSFIPRKLWCSANFITMSGVTSCPVRDATLYTIVGPMSMHAFRCANTPFCEHAGALGSWQGHT